MISSGAVLGFIPSSVFNLTLWHAVQFAIRWLFRAALPDLQDLAGSCHSWRDGHEYRFPTGVDKGDHPDVSCEPAGTAESSLKYLKRKFKNFEE